MSTYSTPDEAREESATELVGMLSDLIMANGRLVRIAARAAGDPESPAIWRTLGVLVGSGPLRLGELAIRSRVSQPTMTKIVAGLTERGYVTRIPDAADARACVIAVTPEGAAAHRTWCHKLGQVLAPHFSDVSPAEIEALRTAVRLIQDRVESDGRDAAAAQPHRATHHKERSAE